MLFRSITKGDKVGTLDIYNGKTLEKSIDLVAKNNLNSIFGFITENTTVKYSIRLVLAICTLFILYVVTKLIKKRNINKRKQSRNRRKRRK